MWSCRHSAEVQQRFNSGDGVGAEQVQLCSGAEVLIMMCCGFAEVVLRC